MACTMFICAIVVTYPWCDEGARGPRKSSPRCSFRCQGAFSYTSSNIDSSARRRRALRFRDGLAKASFDARAELLVVGVAPERVLREIAAHALDRIARRPGLERLALAVALRIVARRVAAHAVGDGLDQRRPLAAHAALDGLLRGRDDREQVVAVHAHAVNAVGDRLLGEGSRGRLPLHGHADRPAVVAAQEDDGQLEDAREVQPAVEIGRARRAVAEVDERRDVFLLDLGAPGEADGLRDLRADGRADRRPADGPAGVVAGHLPALHRVVGVAEHVVDVASAAACRASARRRTRGSRETRSRSRASRRPTRGWRPLRRATRRGSRCGPGAAAGRSARRAAGSPRGAGTGARRRRSRARDRARDRASRPRRGRSRSRPPKLGIRCVSCGRRSSGRGRYHQRPSRHFESAVVTSASAASVAPASSPRPRASSSTSARSAGLTPPETCAISAATRTTSRACSGRLMPFVTI